MENPGSSEDAQVVKSLDYLKSVMVPGETPEAWAIQRRLFALSHRRILIAATSGRFIVIKQGLLGGFDMIDFRWQDLDEIKLRVGIFGADIFVKTFESSDLAVAKSSVKFLQLTGFRRDQLEAVYRIAQAHDQSWREKRRIRELEELRAKSGGLSMSSNYSGIPSASNTHDDSISRLQKAKEMLENKLITDAEYESIKARIISGL